MRRGRRRSQNCDPFGRRGFKRRRSRLRSARPSSAVKQLTICLKMHPHPSCHSLLADSRWREMALNHRSPLGEKVDADC